MLHNFFSAKKQSCFILRNLGIGILFLFGMGFSALAGDFHELKTIPVLENGRIKPLDTFARESLQLVYGKTSYKKDGGEKLQAIEVMLIWIMQPSAWENTPMFEISYAELKKQLGFDVTRKHFSLKEITSADSLSRLMQDLNSKRESKEKLDPMMQAIQRLESQVVIFREIASGNLLHIFPPKEGKDWLSAGQVTDSTMQEPFVKVMQAFTQYVVSLAKAAPQEEKEKEMMAVESAAKEFKAFAKSLNPEAYPSETKMNIELHYQEFHPFQWAWTFYLLAAIASFVAWMSTRKQWMWPAWIFALIGFALNIYGFALRVYIAERAPVTNMYETVILVGFGAVLFSMIIEFLYRWRFILFAGTLLGTFSLVLADMAPVILNGSLHPLEPVLRNNFWLLIHVLMITISYAAFFLAFMLGDIGLVYFLVDEEKHKDRIKAISLAIYRALQIGVALLGPGIIMGGIWADYSWGRFWGWDPKETWALIAFLGYLAVLHGKVGGLIKDFGLMAYAIVTFSLVIMAWYGVNYVLGAGLHSYGFGAGGIEYVSVFVAAHLCYVIFVTFYRRAKMKTPA